MVNWSANVWPSHLTIIFLAPVILRQMKRWMEGAWTIGKLQPTHKPLDDVCWMWHPMLWSLLTTDFRCVGTTGKMEMVERVMAAAIKNVQASILSGIIWYSVPCSFLLPTMLSVLVPAPWMLAPQEIKTSARSTTSSSWHDSHVLAFSSWRHFLRLQWWRLGESDSRNYLGHIWQQCLAISQSCSHHESFCGSYTWVVKTKVAVDKMFAIHCTDVHLALPTTTCM